MAPPAAAPVPPRSLAASGGLSMKWIVVPTLIYVFLARSTVTTIIAAAIGYALWQARTYPLPPTAPPWLRALHPYRGIAPALQILVVFVLIGGSLFAVAAIVAGIFFVMKNYRGIIHALEPWWRVQSAIPAPLRKLLAFGLAAWIGFKFGENASGVEWTYTLLSISTGAAVTLLMLFTPPASLRRTS